MKHLFLSLFCLFAGSLTLSAQSDFEVPEYEFKSPQDYKDHEENIVAASKWLAENPLEKDRSLRKEINAYIIDWAQGTPDVSLMIGSELMAYTKENPDLLAVYMASYCAYMIQQDYKGEAEDAAKAGLVDMMKVYESSKKVQKCKKMDKAIKKKDDLDPLVKKILSK